jgi:3',5'-cyclic AMP phosphodiesterase CpdA
MLPDGLERVSAFVAAMAKARVDFILQLGDFVWPAPANRRFLEAWNAFDGPRYHVLGNHDMDEGYTREQTVAFCEMPAMHYAFTAGPIRGLVLDGNEPGGKAAGYRRFMGSEQLAWLERELVVEGRRTEWVGPDPWERGEITDRPHEHLHPWISDRRLKVIT